MYTNISEFAVFTTSLDPFPVIFCWFILEVSWDYFFAALFVVQLFFLYVCFAFKLYANGSLLCVILCIMYIMPFVHASHSSQLCNIYMYAGFFLNLKQIVSF